MEILYLDRTYSNDCLEIYDCGNKLLYNTLSFKDLTIPLSNSVIEQKQIKAKFPIFRNNIFVLSHSYIYIGDQYFKYHFIIKGNQKTFLFYIQVLNKFILNDISFSVIKLILNYCLCKGGIKPLVRFPIRNNDEPFYINDKYWKTPREDLFSKILF